ncbi:MAG: hypothetical protein H8E44_00160 [Planctomycetes bacterium]|nr:hypothetical protein [Planctomycetota bacterium]
MRLAGQLKGGFYPAPPEAIEHIASYLIPPDGPFHILDPCAGEGAAIKQFGVILNCVPANVHAIELDEGRTERLLANLPDSRVLAPASFFGTTVKHGAFGFVWANPPYTDEIGGGARVEEKFLARALRLVAPKGILALAVPERVAKWDYALRRQIKTWLDNVQLVPYPDDHRKYDEVVIIGVKRAKMGNPYDADDDWTDEGRAYQIPESLGPGERFLKSDLTDAEYADLLTRSPLMEYLDPPAEPPLPRPPLAPGVGHLALLLASGHLDGIVEPPGEAPHVVRGVAKKTQYVKDETKEDLGEGKSKTKTVYSERITLTVRAVAPDGEMYTFTDEPEEKEDDTDDERAA